MREQPVNCNQNPPSPVRPTSCSFQVGLLHTHCNRPSSLCTPTRSQPLTHFPKLGSEFPKLQIRQHVGGKIQLLGGGWEGGGCRGWGDKPAGLASACHPSSLSTCRSTRLPPSLHASGNALQFSERAMLSIHPVCIHTLRPLSSFEEP